MNQVTCSQCRKFIRDPRNPDAGLGQCDALETYKTHLKAQPISPGKYNEQLTSAERALGIMPPRGHDPVRLLYPSVVRDCQKFLEH